MINRFATFFVLILLFSCQPNRQSIDVNKERINQICDQIMNNFVNGDVTTAMKILRQNSVVAPSAIDTLQNTIAFQMNTYFPAYGKILSADLVSERSVKDFLARRLYLLRFEKYYLKFDFTLYKSNQSWTITSFHYNDEVEELMR